MQNTDNAIAKTQITRLHFKAFVIETAWPVHTLLGQDVLLGETVVGMESLFGLPADLSPAGQLALQPDADWAGLADLPLVKVIAKSPVPVAQSKT